MLRRSLRLLKSIGNFVVGDGQSTSKDKKGSKQLARRTQFVLRLAGLTVAYLLR
jgi:hypothetical protein